MTLLIICNIIRHNCHYITLYKMDQTWRMEVQQQILFWKKKSVSDKVMMAMAMHTILFGYYRFYFNPDQNEANLELALSVTPFQSIIIQASSSIIKCHQASSSVIKCHQASSSVISSFAAILNKAFSPLSSIIKCPFLLHDF